MSKADSRYPYTYAADFVRIMAGYGDSGSKLARSDASLIRKSIAEAIGMPDEELAIKLADHFLKNRDAIEQRSLQQFEDLMRGAVC